MKYLLALCAFILCSACTTQPQPVPAPAPDPTPVVIGDAAPEPEDVDAAHKATAATACESMHAAGCDEAGSVASCTSVIQHAVTAKLTKVDLACLTAAKTKAAVRKCSFVVCQ